MVQLILKKGVPIVKHNKRKLITYIIVFTVMGSGLLWANIITKNIKNPVPYEQKMSDSFFTKFIKKTESFLTNISIQSDSTASQRESLNIDQSNKELKQAKVIRIKDGDTIVAEIDNVEYTIRMIGINTPESVHPDTYHNTEIGEQASDFTKSQLKKNDTIWLQTDTSDKDEYGRLLRYIWLSDDIDITNKTDIMEFMYNAILLNKNMAEPMKIEPNTIYADIFQDIYENRKEDNNEL